MSVLLMDESPAPSSAPGYSLREGMDERNASAENKVLCGKEQSGGEVSMLPARLPTAGSPPASMP